jgi:hypothetical protein
MSTIIIIIIIIIIIGCLAIMIMGAIDIATTPRAHLPVML